MTAALLSTFLVLLPGADGDAAPLCCLLPGADGDAAPLCCPAPPSACLSTACDTAPVACAKCQDTDTTVFWVGSEYLLWWAKKSPLPVPLVTLGSASDVAPGALGEPGTRVLYGGQGVNYGATSGFRINAGLLLDADAGLSLEGSYFRLATSTQSFAAGSNSSGSPVLGQPIVDAVTGKPGVEDVSFPNPFGFAGGINVESTSRLQGWDTNLGLVAWSNDQSRLVLLAGFRSLDLLENLSIQATFTDVSGIPGGAGLTFLGVKDTLDSKFSTLDSFRTSNIFYGGQVGARYTQELGLFSVSLQGKVALGSTNEVVTISGASAQQPPGLPSVTVPGGVLTQTSNIGRYYRSEFSVVPEGTFSLGVQLAPWLRATVGYNFLYWSEVARPGNQIDPVVNRAHVPTDESFGATGPARPAFSFQGSDYWAQGLSFGLELRY